jgi:hypothetical protein
LDVDGRWTDDIPRRLSIASIRSIGYLGQFSIEAQAGDWRHWEHAFGSPHPLFVRPPPSTFHDAQPLPSPVSPPFPRATTQGLGLKADMHRGPPALLDHLHPSLQAHVHHRQLDRSVCTTSVVATRQYFCSTTSAQMSRGHLSPGIPSCLIPERGTRTHPPLFPRDRLAAQSAIPRPPTAMPIRRDTRCSCSLSAAMSAVVIERGTASSAGEAAESTTVSSYQHGAPATFNMALYARYSSDHQNSPAHFLEHLPRDPAWPSFH